MGSKTKSTLVHDALMLFLITLIAGLALGFCNEATKKARASAEEKATNEAFQKVYPDAESFSEDDAIKDKVKDSDKFLADNKLTGAKILEVRIAKDADGKAVGYVAKFNATEGYGGDVTLSLGMTNEGEITGFEVLNCSETPGLGAKCKEPKFKDQFKGIKADNIEYIKQGKKKDNQIDAISGATITTKAVTKGVNGAIEFLRNDVMQG